MGIYCPSDSARMLLDDVLALLEGDVDSDISERSREREDRISQYSYEDKVYQNARKESSSNIAKPKPSEGPYSLEIAEIKEGNAAISMADGGDEDALHYLKLSENLDILVSASIENDGIDEIIIRIDGQQAYRNLYTAQNEDDVFMDVAELFLMLLRSDSHALLRLELPYSVSCMIDDKSVNPVRGYIILGKGEHSIELSSPMYKSYSGTFDLEESLVFEPVLEKRESSLLSVDLRPADSSLFLNGKMTDSRLLYVTYPMTITATREGFSLYSFQSMKRLDSLEIDMRPKWMEGVSLTGDGKSDFYDKLLKTLFSFGAYVGSLSLAGIYPDLDLRPAAVALMGISLVQLMEMADSMFSYYRSSQLGI